MLSFLTCNVVVDINLRTDLGAAMVRDLEPGATIRGGTSDAIVASGIQEPSANDITYLQAAIEDGDRLPNKSHSPETQVTRRALIVRSSSFSQIIELKE
jgi:hypothetical protein